MKRSILVSRQVVAAALGVVILVAPTLARAQRPLKQMAEPSPAELGVPRYPGAQFDSSMSAATPVVGALAPAAETPSRARSWGRRSPPTAALSDLLALQCVLPIDS